MLENCGRDQLIALSLKYQGNWEHIYRDLQAKKGCTKEEIESLLSQVKSRVVTMLDPDYPKEVYESCPRPPFVLYYYGDLSLIQDKEKIVTVVGSREPEPGTGPRVRSICEELARRGFIIASGLARGIDTVAAESSVGIPGRTIAVLGCGIDNVYPLENRALKTRIAGNGLVISEYPGMVPPRASQFPARNRILATLSQGTLIGEAKRHSGTLITAAFCLSTNHDIATLPQPAGSELMNNFLIKNGAALVEDAEDMVLFLTTGRPVKKA